CEVFADAATRTAAEREVRVARPILAPHEAVGVEPVRLGPERGVPVGDPGGYENDRSGRYEVAGDLDLGGGPALRDVCRRIKAHRLVHGGSGQLHRTAVVGGHPLLEVRVVAEQVQREGQGGRGGLVPGEQEDQYLVADLRRRQGLAGLRVTR